MCKNLVIDHNNQIGMSIDQNATINEHSGLFALFESEKVTIFPFFFFYIIFEPLFLMSFLLLSTAIDTKLIFPQEKWATEFHVEA